MANRTMPYKWDIDTNYTSNFMIESRYYDFKYPGVPKTIYSVTLGFGLRDVTISDCVQGTLYYRTAIESNWHNYGAFWITKKGTDYASNAERTDSQKLKKIIKNVDGIQFRIEAYIAQKAYLNDITMVYRLMRNRAVTGA